MRLTHTTCCFLLLTTVSWTAFGQDPSDITGSFWDARSRQEAASAAQLVLACDPITAAILRHEGLRWKVWREPEFASDFAPELNAAWLEDLRDGMATPDVRGKTDDDLRKDQRAYVHVFSQAIVFANEVPADVFAKSATDNEHVTFAHLWRDSERYRGKVIPINGRLVRLRKLDAPKEALARGVPFVYEGWIQGPTRDSYPFWVIFPILPEGLKEAEKMDREVSFNGYFLVKMTYKAANSKSLQTPLLVGPTVLLKDTPIAVPVSSPISLSVIAVVLGVVTCAAASVVLLSWYFRRGDRALQERLEQLQKQRTVALPDQETTE